MIRANHWGLINNVETFKKWVEEIIVANHLEKVVFSLSGMNLLIIYVTAMTVW